MFKAKAHGQERPAETAAADESRRAELPIRRRGFDWLLRRRGRPACLANQLVSIGVNQSHNDRSSSRYQSWQARVKIDLSTMHSTAI
jgi:hypothetical protein